MEVDTVRFESRFTLVAICCCDALNVSADVVVWTSVVLGAGVGFTATPDFEADADFKTWLLLEAGVACCAAVDFAFKTRLVLSVEVAFGVETDSAVGDVFRSCLAFGVEFIIGRELYTVDVVFGLLLTFGVTCDFNGEIVVSVVDERLGVATVVFKVISVGFSVAVECCIFLVEVVDCSVLALVSFLFLLSGKVLVSFCLGLIEPVAMFAAMVGMASVALGTFVDTWDLTVVSPIVGLFLCEVFSEALAITGPFVVGDSKMASTLTSVVCGKGEASCSLLMSICVTVD